MRGATQEEHGIYIPPELWRHIGSFVPWCYDGAAAARRVCVAFRDGVNDTARQLLLLSPNKLPTLLRILPRVMYPHLAYCYRRDPTPRSGGGAVWSQVLASVYGSCMHCSATHWWNTACSHATCARVICMTCRDAIDPCGQPQQQQPAAQRRALGACCNSCSAWYCPERVSFSTCRCTRDMCASCIVSCFECGETSCSACTCDCEEEDEEEDEEEEDEEEEDDDEEDEEDEEEPGEVMEDDG